MIQSLRHLDETLLLWFNGFHTSFLDNLALSVSSRWLWLPLYVTLFALIARKVGWNRTLVYVTLLFLLTVGLADYTCASILRPIFQRPRPTQPDSPIFHLVHAVQNYRGGHYGFPSCHASNAFALATLSALYFRVWRLSVCLGVAALPQSYVSRRPLSGRHPLGCHHRRSHSLYDLRSCAPAAPTASKLYESCLLAARRYRGLALLFHYPSLLIAAKSWLCALHKVSNRKRRLRPLALLSYFFEDNRQRRHPSFRFSF